MGGVHGDAMRRLRGTTSSSRLIPGTTSGAFYASDPDAQAKLQAPFSSTYLYYSQNLYIDNMRVMPVANKNQVRSWGSLACVYLGLPAS